MSEFDFDLSALQESATQLHEWFLSLKKAGFTSSEAIQLIGTVMGTYGQGKSE